MDETDLFEELLKIKTDEIEIELKGNTKKNNLRPKIFVIGKKGSIKSETLNKIIWITNKNNGKLVLKSYGVLEITF